MAQKYTQQLIVFDTYQIRYRANVDFFKHQSNEEYGLNSTKTK